MTQVHSIYINLMRIVMNEEECLMFDMGSAELFSTEVKD